jgi:hypothetical protein
MGFIDIRKFLCGHSACDKWAITLAAKNGHLEVVKYLWEQKAPCDKWAIIYAAEEGHVAIVEYLWNQKAPFDVKLVLETCFLKFKFQLWFLGLIGFGLFASLT